MNKRFLFPNSILKTLIGAHLAVLVLGFLGFVLFLQYTSTHRLRNAVLNTKERVQPVLAAHQDRWRAWHMLGLKEVLSQELDQFKKDHPNVTVSVINRNKSVLTENDLVLPSTGTEEEPVVFAHILADNLVPQNQVVEYATTSAILLGVLFLVSLLLSTYLIRKHIQNPLNLLRKRVSLQQTTGEFSVRDIPATGEIKVLLELIATLHERTKQNEKLSAVGEVAQQFAHDIRSPLCALSLAVSSASSLPEEQRRLIQSAIVRINDIANNLDDKKGVVSPNRHECLPNQPQYVLSMLREVLLQKRTEFSVEPGITITENSLCQITRAFAEVDPSAFKTIVSNIINNAREALGLTGRIEVATDVSNSNFLKIIISDNGNGIAPEAIPHLMERGYSSGKKNGSGLGLYHAREHLKKWQGTLDVQSSVGTGTRVTIGVPVVAPPAWFHDQIEVPKDSEIVVVDDDPSIHELWKYRVARAGSDTHRMSHFFTLGAARDWANCRQSDPNGTVYLIDYEFVGQTQSGLDLIKDLGISANSYLVTSRSDDSTLLASCVTAGVRVIPKCTAEYILIRTNSLQGAGVYA